MLTILAAILFNFSLPVMNGAPGEMFQPEKDMVLVVEAYFNTCPYCNENASNVDELAADFQSESRVKVLDVGIDRSVSDYDSWIRKHHPNHPVLMDDKRKLIKQLGTTSYPSTYVLDKNGDVVFKSVGTWNSLTKERIRAAVESALEK